MFSPNLKWYLNFDKIKQRFFIRETLGSGILKIPNFIMDSVREKPLDVVKRFKWIDNSRVLICNSWGLEKLYLLKDNLLEEINASKIPAFTSIKDQQNVYLEP